MRIINDKTCGWINDLPKRTNIKSILENKKCDFLIIGAGYTGLSAARQLAQINSKKKIIIIDAQLAGEGASSRNSGYLVDTTLNDGFTSNKDVQNYKKKTEIYKLGIESVKKFVKEFQVECEWNECGKYFASSNIRDEKKAKLFSQILCDLEFDNEIIYSDSLSERLGTKFYKVAVYTKGGILLHPGKLIRAMIDTLPQSVELLENTQLTNWKKVNNKIYCNLNNFEIITDKIIFCVNGFLNSLGLSKNYSFPITLTASMTRKLSKNELELIGQPKEWGVLPIRPMGATIRFTKDKRILIRNTAEVRNPNFMSPAILKKRINLHKIGISKRFPTLPNDIIKDTWSGIVCRSGNSSQIFEKIDNSIYVAGCYNGSGIGVGTLFGEQIANMASNQQSNQIESIANIKKPNLLPPQPFLNIGIYSRLMYERFKARLEI